MQQRENLGDPSGAAPRRGMSAALIGIIGVVLVIAIAIAMAAAARDARQSAGQTAGGGESGTRAMTGMPMTESGTVRLTADQIRQFGVTFGTADVRTLTSETRATGVVTVDETKVAQIAPKVGGFVERLYVNATGQPVSRGQPLLDVYSPDLVAAQQELLVAGHLQRDIGRSAVPGVPDNVTDLVGAAKRRLRLWDISEGQIEEILRTGQAQRTLTLHAPASGVVLEKRVVQGQAVVAGEQLYTIADLSDVWVDVRLREADVAAVRPGSGAEIEVAGLPDRALKGRVTYVYPTLDTASRAVRARVVVANTGGLLKPGMYATVRLSTPSRSALAVPNSAVLRSGDRNVVFVDMGRGALMPHEVEVGRTAGGYAEILAGLEPGQRVVTSAQFILDSESNLDQVMKAMMGQMSGGDMSKMQDGKDMPGMSMPKLNDKGADVRGMHDMPGMKTPPAAAPRR
jgi:Cu(I)/Ag(I) efflux system membrane fusion protein